MLMVLVSIIGCAASWWQSNIHDHILLHSCLTYMPDLTVTVILYATYLGHHPTTILNSNHRSEVICYSHDYVRIRSWGNTDHIISTSCLLIMMMTQSWWFMIFLVHNTPTYQRSDPTDCMYIYLCTYTYRHVYFICIANVYICVCSRGNSDHSISASCRVIMMMLLLDWLIKMCPWKTESNHSWKGLTEVSFE